MKFHNFKLDFNEKQMSNKFTYILNNLVANQRQIDSKIAADSKNS